MAINDLNSMIIFNDVNEKIDKLKEWKLLSPKAKELKDIYYKSQTETCKCEILGYFKKKTNVGCLNSFYETAVIKAVENIINVAPAYLLEMQKKDFSSFKSDELSD